MGTGWLLDDKLSMVSEYQQVISQVAVVK